MANWLDIVKSLIVKWEGFEEQAYQDVTGTWTVGYGFTYLASKPVTRASCLTKEEAVPLLELQLNKNNNLLDTECFVSLSDHQRGALLSLGWNIGMARLGRSSLMSRLNEGAYGDAATQFLVFTFSKGVQVNGLMKRREDELKTFNTSD